MAQRQWDVTPQQEEQRIRRALRKTINSMDVCRQVAVLAFAQELLCPGALHEAIYNNSDARKVAQHLGLA